MQRTQADTDAITHSLLTVPEAAQRLRIGHTLVWELVATGQLESIKIGRLRRVPVEAIDAYIERRRAAVA